MWMPAVEAPQRAEVSQHVQDISIQRMPPQEGELRRQPNDEDEKRKRLPITDEEEEVLQAKESPQRTKGPRSRSIVGAREVQGLGVSPKSFKPFRRSGRVP